MEKILNSDKSIELRKHEFEVNDSNNISRQSYTSNASKMDEKSSLISSSNYTHTSSRYDPAIQLPIITVSTIPSSSTQSYSSLLNKKKNTRYLFLVATLFTSFACACLYVVYNRIATTVSPDSSSNGNNVLPTDYFSSGAMAYASEPFSVVNPATIGLQLANRPAISQPGAIFAKAKAPLPTNSWCENFFLGPSNNLENNHAFQLPYIIDTGGSMLGIRTHPAHVQANDRTVMMTYEGENGLTLGAVEQFLPQHTLVDNIPSLARLAIVLQWSGNMRLLTGKGPGMRVPIVRGSPYTTMEYISSTPRVISERAIRKYPVVDGVKTLVCGDGLLDEFSAKPILVEREIEMQFDTSDMTWILFVSEPTEFICSNTTVIPPVNNLPPGVVPPKTVGGVAFDLRTTKPLKKGVIRLAMSNNCTTGQNPQYCDGRKTGKDNREFTDLLRKYAEYYPTGYSGIEFTFPSDSQEEEELRLNFNWAQMSMKEFATSLPVDSFDYPMDKIKKPLTADTPDVLMYGIPHHQERLASTSSITRLKVYHNIGCTPTLHGSACPVSANGWSQIEHLHRNSFYASKPIADEMLDEMKIALKKDIKYRIPVNYMKGAGDTYFSGKMLAKLGRILLIADQVKGSVTDEEFNDALLHLQEGVDIWYNGSAKSPLLYDNAWGGVVMCGCDFDGETNGCHNQYPNCPAVIDAGSNFGAGFYNDHHYHFGYHIYAAAVVGKYNKSWLKKNYENVLLLIRDIANPSENDPYFPTFRHKDWYLGFSWASGIVTIQGQPYPNGRNQESSSEAIHAYEAVALFGEVAIDVFSDGTSEEDKIKEQTSQRIRDLGRLLCATELRSAKTYWHVQSNDPAVTRVYPEIYTPKVVGMLWSMLAQEQTWFGNEEYKSYGIQLLPLTAISELRDTASWVEEMLPLFTASCLKDVNCELQGWSILVLACMAVAGKMEEAKAGALSLSDDVYETAGGNGHSKSNTLWYISTR